LSAQPHNIEFLRGIEPRVVTEILQSATRHKIAPKTILTRQGEPADRMFLLWTGVAQYFSDLPNGRRLRLRWLLPGDIIGAAALVSRPSTYVVSAKTRQESVLLEWDRPTIRSFATRYCKIFENVVFLAREHFSWYVTTYASLVSDNPEERLAHVLLEMHRLGAPSTMCQGGRVIDIGNQELAERANISESTVQRIMHKLQAQGTIRKRRNKLCLCRIEGLFPKLVQIAPAPLDLASVPLNEN
jgi:CRP-like cAMP-binding protein